MAICCVDPNEYEQTTLTVTTKSERAQTVAGGGRGDWLVCGPCVVSAHSADIWLSGHIQYKWVLVFTPASDLC